MSFYVGAPSVFVYPFFMATDTTWIKTSTSTKSRSVWTKGSVVITGGKGSYGMQVNVGDGDTGADFAQVWTAFKGLTGIRSFKAFAERILAGEGAITGNGYFEI